MNSVVQMRNDGKKNSNGAIICGFSNGFKAPSGGQFWYGGIKSITIKNSTIYNIESNSKNRMSVSTIRIWTVSSLQQVVLAP